MLLTFFPQKTVFTVKCLLSDYVHDAAQYYMKGTGISWIEAVCISFYMRICLKDGIILVSFLASVRGRYKTGYQRYVGGESSMRGRVYANILIDHVEFMPQ